MDNVLESVAAVVLAVITIIAIILGFPALMIASGYLSF